MSVEKLSSRYKFHYKLDRSSMTYSRKMVNIVGVNMQPFRASTLTPIHCMRFLLEQNGVSSKTLSTEELENACKKLSEGNKKENKIITDEAAEDVENLAFLESVISARSDDIIRRIVA